MKKITKNKAVIARRSAVKKAATYLNKSEAAHYLHSLYDEYIDAKELDDIHPDLYSLLTENQRNPLSPSAIEQGYPRGNRGAYGKIPCIRISNRPMFFKSKLKEWFDMRYAPKLHQVTA